jgi:hypothetical protein
MPSPQPPCDAGLRNASSLAARNGTFLAGQKAKAVHSPFTINAPEALRMFHHHTDSNRETHSMSEREFTAFVNDMVASLDQPASEAQKAKHSKEPNTARHKR